MAHTLAAGSLDRAARVRERLSTVIADAPATSNQRDRLWSVPVSQVLSSLGASPDGLASADAARRLTQYGANTPGAENQSGALRLLGRQFASPIILLLVGAAVLSSMVHDRTDALTILAIVGASGVLAFWQEYSAGNIVTALLAKVQLRATVLRDGSETSVPSDAVVPGDVVVVSAGSGIPADCRLLASRDLFVDEAALTGESYPVEKRDGQLPLGTPLARRANALFMGTHTVSGTARAVVVCTGSDTEFGRISSRVRVRPPETEFERGIRRFGTLLVQLTLLFVIAIFVMNVYLHKPVLDSFLFALALAVGLTPQLLPAIISVNLARGANAMARRKVIVKRPAAIENLGSMDVLCSDKTGTLTEGRVRLDAALDAAGRTSERVLLHAYVNATLQTGYANPIDTAIREHCALPVAGWTKLDEVPYDFIRRRLTILADDGGTPVMIAKGALRAVLDVCERVETDDGPRPITDLRASIQALQATLERRGLRTLGVAMKVMPPGTVAIGRTDERGMSLLGLLVLCDPPKDGAKAAVATLASLGVALKVITGDSALVAEQIARQVGIDDPVVMTGQALHEMTDDTLSAQAARTNVFAEIEPGQKERVIRALKRAGHVVGYMGDGINDAPALHAADVSISVQQAADVAKAAADIVLLEQDLGVLEHGVREGRRTFANTLKYVFMATSANFGNMFSMAGASLFLPFLPLLPKQILLMNVLTDLPALAISTDRVDADWIERPRRWNVRFIRRFMVVFGLLSSAFDYVTFGALLHWLHAPPIEFRTGWFLESVVSAVLIVLVIRTRRGTLTNPPSAPLGGASACVVAAALGLPYTRAARAFGLAAVPPPFVAAMAAVVFLYVMSAEAAKHWFYRPSAARA